MATPQPPLTPEQRLAQEQKQKFDKMARNVAIGGIILCPTIALLPPRKLDLYTLALGVGFYLSADHLSTSYTGRGVVEHITPRWGTLPTEKARETQRLFAEQKRLSDGDEALRQGREKGNTEEQKTILQRIWMGGEKEGWKERRMEEERKALREGKSYTSMIIGQIWEVWNWEKKEDGEGQGAVKDAVKDEKKKS